MWLKRIIPATVAITACTAVALWAARDDGTDYPYIPYDHPVIDYDKRAPQDPIARLQEKLLRGDVELEFDSKEGYLPSLFKQLDINADSQMLVFSKTSFQGPKISPRSPRALYFNDNVAIGFVPNGDVMEFTALDPNQGIIFYTMERKKAEKPSFFRRGLECLNCHILANTQNVPGLLATSVIPRPDGSPRFAASALVVDSRTPLDQRWGGWYVTGLSGGLQHRGNSVSPNPDRPSELALRNNQNVTSLESRFDVSNYMLPTSDLVALMTLEHQNRMTSYFTRINWEARIAEQEGKMTEFEPRLDFLTDEMVAYMLFENEARMYDPMSGVSTFAKTFPARGPRDKKGRSLRDFDLQTRVFRYPLSYMIYNPAFDAMPGIAKDQVYRKLFDKLTSPVPEKDARLSNEDRQAILEILADTKPGLPDYWKTK
ncbi:MAG: hypothetical protein ABI811_12700 [Acidobacteriota bacterium]